MPWRPGSPYFLWRSMPDQQLIDLATQKKLRSPDELRRQVERMLQDPKAAALAEQFLGQWLGLRQIDATTPDRVLYPEFDDYLKYSMLKEPQLFFEEMLKNDLKIQCFIDSDFSMLNDRLARHYGIEGVEGPEFRKVKLPAGCHRGGVLTMAAVLKVTANGTVTSPVLRGAWLHDKIMGQPLQLPSDLMVPAVEPDIRGALEHPRSVGEAPHGGSVCLLPPEDRPARLRPRELRPHRRLSHQLPRPGEVSRRRMSRSTTNPFSIRTAFPCRPAT